jgi:hypothetical protein
MFIDTKVAKVIVVLHIVAMYLTAAEKFFHFSAAAKATGNNIFHTKTKLKYNKWQILVEKYQHLCIF